MSGEGDEVAQLDDADYAAMIAVILPIVKPWMGRNERAQVRRAVRVRLHELTIMYNRTRLITRRDQDG